MCDVGAGSARTRRFELSYFKWRNRGSLEMMVGVLCEDSSIMAALRNKTPPWDLGSTEERIAMRVKNASPPTTELEKKHFFSELPSRPRLVARTGEQWQDSRFGPLCKFLCPISFGRPEVKRAFDSGLSSRLSSTCSGSFRRFGLKSIYIGGREGHDPCRTVWLL